MKTMRLLLMTLALGWLAASTCQAFYNPETGRWLSRDPIGEEGGENLYAPVANDPIRRIDPRGMSLWPFRKKECQKCCCCAEDVRITNVVPVHKGFYFGHAFNTVINLRYVKFTKETDCTLEWWERTDDPYT